MKIKRIINGVTYEFELTNSERFDAYIEQEHEWDVDYVRNEWDNEDLDPEERESMVEDVAYEMRRQVNKYCMSDYEALCIAADLVIAERSGLRKGN